MEDTVHVPSKMSVPSRVKGLICSINPNADDMQMFLDVHSKSHCGVRDWYAASRVYGIGKTTDVHFAGSKALMPSETGSHHLNQCTLQPAERFNVL